jgi:Rrf2 family protein
MNLSLPCTSTLHALVAVAQASDGHQVTTDSIVEAGDLSPSILQKLMGDLVQADILDARQGPGGGLRLARPACHITLLEIIEAVDGPVRAIVPGCDSKFSQVMAKLLKVYQKGTDQQRLQLARVRLSDLVCSGGNGTA